MTKTRAVMVLLLVAYGALLIGRTSRVVGGSDSSGYFNAAKLLATGHVSRPIPIPPELHVTNRYAFHPLAFIPRPDLTMVAFYPIGYPLHLVAVAAIAGWDPAPFYVAPLAAVAVVLLTFLLTRRYASEITAAIAALCMACCPILISTGLQPMSDVVAAAWCAAAFLAATYDHRLGAILAGAAMGVAVLVRPTNALMLFPLLLLIPPRRYFWAALGGAPFAIALGLYNWRAFGSPLASGYSQIGLLAAVHFAGFEERAGSYLDWTVRQLGPAVLVAFLSLPLIREVPLRVRAALIAWFGSFFVFYACYEIYGDWGATRFILPGYPSLIAGAALTAEHLFRKRTWIAIATAGAIGVFTLAASIHKTWQYNALGNYDRPLLNAIDWLNHSIPPGSILITTDMSGSAIYYTSHYPLRWEWVTPDEMKTYIDTAAAHGRGTWAVLVPSELPDFEKRHGPLKESIAVPGPFYVFRLR